MNQHDEFEGDETNDYQGPPRSYGSPIRRPRPKPGGYNRVSENASRTDRSSIKGRLDRLEALLEQMTATSERLISNIDPILMPAPISMEEERDGIGRPPMSDLAYTVESLTDKTVKIIQRLEETIDRIEIT